MVYSRSGLKKEANIALKKFYITSKIVVTYNKSRVQPAEQQKHHIEQSIYRDIYKYIYNANTNKVGPYLYRIRANRGLTLFHQLIILS